MNETELRMLDILEPDEVEILIDASGKRIWINVNGVCRLRIGRIKSLDVRDPRLPE